MRSWLAQSDGVAASDSVPAQTVGDPQRVVVQLGIRQREVAVQEGHAVAVSPRRPGEQGVDADRRIGQTVGHADGKSQSSHGCPCPERSAVRCDRRHRAADRCRGYLTNVQWGGRSDFPENATFCGVVSGGNFGLWLYACSVSIGAEPNPSPTERNTMSAQPPGHGAILEAARAEFAERGLRRRHHPEHRTARRSEPLGVVLLLPEQTRGARRAPRGRSRRLHRGVRAGPRKGRVRRRGPARRTGRGNGPVPGDPSREEHHRADGAAQLDPEHQQAYRDHEVRGTERFRAIIEQGIADGQFRTPYPDEARRTIIAMCNAIAEWFDPDGGVSLDEVVERYVAIAFTVVEYRPRRARRGDRTVPGIG